MVRYSFRLYLRYVSFGEFAKIFLINALAFIIYFTGKKAVNWHVEFFPCILNCVTETAYASKKIDKSNSYLCFWIHFIHDLEYSIKNEMIQFDFDALYFFGCPTWNSAAEVRGRLKWLGKQ